MGVGTPWLWLCLWCAVACSADHHSSKAKLALDAHDLVEAEARYRQALDRDSTHAEALAGLGWTYLLAGQADAARGAFERCHETNPQAPDCLRGAAAVASGEGNPAHARRLLEQALVLDPHHAGVNSSLALLALAGGNLDIAAEKYAHLVTRYPDQAEYRLGLAEVQLRRDAYKPALATIDAGLAQSDTPLRYRAMLYQTRARTLVAGSAGRLDPARCAATSPMVRAWLGAADTAAESAKATGVVLPDLVVVRRLLRRRRTMLDEACPL
jgi:tetratricopeptide (TPR) repeat protein